MRLFQHQDFEQAVLAAVDHFHGNGWTAAFIEKDYYTTEALRLIGAEAGDKVIFKGGTSLSKGWDIVQRFSEDLDLFFDPQAFDPELGKNAIDRELRNLRDKIQEHPAFTFLQQPSRTIGGAGRNDYFEYQQRFGGVGVVTNRILCEVGTASGRQPCEDVQIHSYLGKFLSETGTTLNCEDEGPFTLRLLHFRRTFVEKLFAIHAKVELYLRDGEPIGTYSRHYYDLYHLGKCQEVLEMLRSDEYTQIKEDYEQISLRHYPKGYFRPDQMSFSNSRALFPRASCQNTLVKIISGSARYFASAPSLRGTRFFKCLKVCAPLFEASRCLTFEKNRLRIEISPGSGETRVSQGFLKTPGFLIRKLPHFRKLSSTASPSRCCAKGPHPEYSR